MLSNGKLENFDGTLTSAELAGGGDGDVGDTATGGGVCDCFVFDSISDD